MNKTYDMLVFIWSYQSHKDGQTFNFFLEWIYLEGLHDDSLHFILYDLNLEGTDSPLQLIIYLTSERCCNFVSIILRILFNLTSSCFFFIFVFCIGGWVDSWQFFRVNSGFLHIRNYVFQFIISYHPSNVAWVFLDLFHLWGLF